MNSPTDPQIAAKSGASNADIAMAAAVSTNKIIQHKRDTPWGGTQSHCEGVSNNEACPILNSYLQNLMTYGVSGVEVGLFDDQPCFTELYSHANMIVIGKHCLDINGTYKLLM